MWQIAKEEQLIEELEADVEEHPFEDSTDEEEPERKKLKRDKINRARAIRCFSPLERISPQRSWS